MMLRSEPALVATWTPASGLHSSSRTVSSYVYFALASWLRSLTARSAELRPPRPIAELPPVRGPTNAIRTVSFAPAVVEASAAAAQSAAYRVRMGASSRFVGAQPSTPVLTHRVPPRDELRDRISACV